MCSRIRSYILFLKFYFILFIYFWLCWVFTAACGLSLVVAKGGYSSLRCSGLSLWWLLLLRSMGSRLTGSVVVTHWLSCSAWHVGSSWTRAWIHVPCIGRQILNHCATREAPEIIFFFFLSYILYLSSFNYYFIYVCLPQLYWNYIFRKNRILRTHI